MMKMYVLISSLLTLFTFGCASLRGPDTKTTDQLTQSTSGHQNAIDSLVKTTDYTHEMAEADADDKSITQEIGTEASSIDDELPSSGEVKIPYARTFLKYKNTTRVQFWVDYFTKKNRDRFQRFINNGEEYRPIIEKIFEEHGLPKELYFVGLIESGYYLGARSHASAVGPWQFIKGTGQRYQLKINREIDERQDLFKASRAAAGYFKDLHNLFSSWELALSAYNAGEYGIIRRILKHGTRDFYQLSKMKALPSETINYVPKVLAAMHVINNAEKYGLHIPQKKFKIYDQTYLTPVKKNLPLKSVAQKLNVDVNYLKKLNPELKMAKTPRYFQGTYYLRVPGTRDAQDFKEFTETSVNNEVAIEFTKPESKKEINRRTARVINEERPLGSHKVEKGETLFSIARHYQMSPKKVASINKFKNWKVKLKRGQNIKVLEIAQSSSKPAHPQVKVFKGPIVYKIRRGDKLAELAKIFDLKLSKIKAANNLRKSADIQIGQKIVLPNTRKGIYTVKKGDHLMKVSRQLNQEVDQLIQLNQLKRGVIYPGQKIIVNMD
jgi:membrane-bound lytic murein transglycosylase D